MTLSRILTALPLLLLAASTVGLSGCMKHKIDDNQFVEAMKKIDGIDEAVRKAIKESEAWRRTLPELEAKLREDAQDLLANEVRNAADAFAAALATGVKEMIDYLEVKIKDNLRALRQALDKARAKVKTARENKDASGIKRAFDELANTKVFHDPVVTKPIPGHVELRWKDHAQKTGYTVRVPRIEVHGWGFERPAGEAPRFGLSVIGADGKERQLLPTAVFSTTRYLMQLQLDVPEVRFAKGDRKLVFTHGPSPADRTELPITHTIPLAPHNSPEVVTGVVVTLQTTGDDKQPWAQVKLSLYDKEVELVHESGAIGGGYTWPRGHARTPYREGDPNPELVRKLEAARRAAKDAAKFSHTGQIAAGIAARCEAEKLALEEQVEESRPIRPTDLTRPIPVESGRSIRLHAELESVPGNKKDAWDAILKVSLYTSRGRRLDFAPVSGKLETFTARRTLDHTFTLPEPQP